MPNRDRDRFVHLHVHGEHSQQDGISRAADLLGAAARDGQPAVALTDHGSIAGTWRFGQAAAAAGIKPILGCLLRGQEIVTDRGVVPVEDVRVGDRVLTHRGRFRTVLRTMARHFVGAGFTIALNGNSSRKLTLTEDHPVLIRTRDGRVGWAKPGEILYGQHGRHGGINDWKTWVCLPKLNVAATTLRPIEYLPTEDGYFVTESGMIGRSKVGSKYSSALQWKLPAAIPLDSEFGWLLGIYAAEGSVMHRTDGHHTGEMAFTLHVDEVEYADRIRAALASFGLVCRTYFPQKAKVLELRVACLPLAQVLAALLGDSAREKRVPELVMNGPACFRDAFLEGVLDGDGKNPERPSNPAGRRNLKVASRSLAWGVRQLLADKGHWVSVGRGVERAVLPQDRHRRLGPVCLRDCEYFAVSYSPSRVYSRSIQDERYIYRPVREIEAVRLDAQVFNFEVDQDNSYVSDFILHNCEAYLAIGDRRLRGSRMVPKDLLGADGGSNDTETAEYGGGEFKRQAYEHLTVLAATATGFGNLARLCADASQHVFTRPRMDYASLAEHAAGLIVLTGCVSGPVAGALLRDGTRKPDGSVFDGRAAAKQAIINLRDIFGRERLFVEVMDHGIHAERRVTEQLFDFARRAGLKAVFTNDSHYTHAADAHLHDLWLCIGENSRKGAGKPPFKIADTNRWRFTGTGYHLRSTTEMWALADGDDRAEQALRNTLLVADMVDQCVLPPSRVRLPRYDRLADHTTSTDMLWSLVRAGAADRWGADWATARPDVVARLDREMAVIDQLGFPDYFLLVREALDAARRAGHRVGPGRGSSAGSAVSYTLQIVDVDPLDNGLLFERFLDPTRTEMPDIDTDLDRAGQQWMFRYLADRWGADRVSRIGAPGFTRARSSIKDVARATLPGQSAITAGGQLAAKVPPVLGISLTGLLDPKNPEGEALRAAVAADPANTELVDRAVGVENLVKQSGVHACGVVVSSEPLAPLTPLRQATADDGQPMWVTEWDVHDLSDLGLVKIDFLGLRTLDVISAAVEQIRGSLGVHIDPAHLDQDPDDPAAAATWAMVGAGRTAGVFQIESASMAGLCERARPSSVDDLSAILALWRPGPISAGFPDLFAARKTGAEPVDYSIFTSDADEEKALRAVLDTTYGLIVYQEQIMQIGSAVAGFGPRMTSKLRKAVSKKDTEAMADIGRLFLDGAQRPVNDSDQPKQAFARSTAKALWAGIQGAGSYAFNRSHSRAYAELTWQTAWLKANYLPQYSAALLACTDTTDKRAAVLMDLRSEQVTVLGPSVNQGAVLTSCDRDGVVRLGLSEIALVGSAGAAIVRERLQGGPFTSLWDLHRRVRVPDGNGSGDTRQLSAAKLMALVEAGALDEFGPRMGLAATIHTVKATAPVPPPDMEWPTLERSCRERRVLGISLSANPLRSARETVTTWRTPDLSRKPVPVHKVPTVDGADTLVLGVLASADTRVFGGRERASIVVEGTRSQLPGMIWPNQLAQITRGRGMPPVGSVVAARGRVRMVEAQRPTDDTSAATTTDDTAPAADKRKELTVFDLWQVELPDDTRPLPTTRTVWSVLTRREPTGQPEAASDNDHRAEDRPGAATQVPAPKSDRSQRRLAAVPEPSAEPEPTPAQPVPVLPMPPAPTEPHLAPTPARTAASAPALHVPGAAAPAVGHPVDVLCVCAGEGLPIGDLLIGRLLTSVNLFGGLDGAAGPSSLHKMLSALPKWSRSRVLRSADGTRRLVIVVVPDTWRPGLTHGVDADRVAAHVRGMKTPSSGSDTAPRASWSLPVVDIPGATVDTDTERALAEALTAPARAAGGAA